MAIFKKLNIGDTVATSGTRVFKKLTTEETGLPIWNGTDLKGTTWIIPAGFTAEAGYGVFYVEGTAEFQDYAFSTGFTRLYIGYDTESTVSDGYDFPAQNTILVRALGYHKRDNTDVQAFIFTGGADVTNPRLIDWLLQNGKLTSHQYPIKGFWRLNDTIAQLPTEYIDVDGLKIDFICRGVRTACSAILAETRSDGEWLIYASFIGAPAYNFGTNSWYTDGMRYLMFRGSTATNLAGEDVTNTLYKYIRDNATKPGKITFSIDGTTYQADEGMNWYQWFNSDYDTGGYGVVSANFTNSVGKDGYNGKKVHTDSGQVDPLDAIIAGYNYILA